MTVLAAGATAPARHEDPEPAGFGPALALLNDEQRAVLRVVFSKARAYDYAMLEDSTAANELEADLFDGRRDLHRTLVEARRQVGHLVEQSTLRRIADLAARIDPHAALIAVRPGERGAHCLHALCGGERQDERLRADDLEPSDPRFADYEELERAIESLTRSVFTAQSYAICDRRDSRWFLVIELAARAGLP